MNPLVSIVTPSFNCGAFIEETLRSVEQQDYPHIEHIVLDSGSTDETLAILARYPSVRVVTAAPQGVSAKVNHGFSIARGEIVAWINADDFYLPGAISKAVDALKRNPGAAVVYCNFLQVDEHSVEIDRERTKQASWQEMLARGYIPVETRSSGARRWSRWGPSTHGIRWYRTGICGCGSASSFRSSTLTTGGARFAFARGSGRTSTNTTSGSRRER